LPSKIFHVEPIAGEHVALPERIAVATGERIQPLVDVDVHLQIDVFQTRDARPARAGVNAPLDGERSVDETQLEMHGRGLVELDALEGFDRYLIVDDEHLTPAGEQSADIDCVTSRHDTLPPD
jgi:hypothetical protein